MENDFSENLLPPDCSECEGIEVRGGTRRRFLAECGSALVGLIVVPALVSEFFKTGSLLETGSAFASQDANVLGEWMGEDISVDVSSLKKAGSFIVAPTKGPDGAPILLIKEAENEFTALSMKCTHKGCKVKPPKNGVMHCPCHGSLFDMSGNAKKGPAKKPLMHYDAEYDGTSSVTIKA